jgi:hypothetical protein
VRNSKFKSERRGEISRLNFDVTTYRIPTSVGVLEDMNLRKDEKLNGM